MFQQAENFPYKLKTRVKFPETQEMPLGKIVPPVIPEHRSQRHGMPQNKLASRLALSASQVQ